MKKADRVILHLILATVIALSGYTMSAYSRNGARSGGQIQNVINRWGRPDTQVTDTDGHTYYIYKRQRYQTYTGPIGPGVGVHVGANNRPVIVQTHEPYSASRGTVTLTCIIMYETDRKGRILSTKMEGSGCR